MVKQEIDIEYSEALVPVEHNELTLPGNLTREQIDLLKKTICKGATDNDLQLFTNVCNSMRLNPFARQIYAVQRYDSKSGSNTMTIQISVDGLRVIAQRSGVYAGQVGPLFCGADGEWKDVWLDDNHFPVAAKVGVLRRDFQQPLWAVAKWTSFAATDKQGGLMPMWAKMPDVMLGKVAESQALRRAFPAELSGLYSPEEMQQADNSVTPQQVRNEVTITEVKDWRDMTRTTATQEGRLAFQDAVKTLGMTGKDVCELYGVSKLNEIPADAKFGIIVKSLEEKVDK